MEGQRSCLTLVWLSLGKERQAGTPDLLSSELWQKWAGTSFTNCCVPSYGVRYLAKVLKTTLAEKFPAAMENEIYKASVSPPHPPGCPLPQWYL